jgi:hypothetical protein
MSREDFLQICHEIRGIPSSPEFDILTTKVVVRTRTWTPGPVNNGVPTDVDVEILPRPRVRESGDGTIIIDRIQPRSALGGYTPQDLVPAEPQAANVERYWVLTAADGVERKYVNGKFVTDRALHYSVEFTSRDLRFPH